MSIHIKYRKFFIITTLFSLISCGSGDECIPADDFGQYEYSQKTDVYPIGKELLITEVESLVTTETSDDGKQEKVASPPVIAGTTENQAYLSAWHEIKPKTIGYNEKGDFIVEKDTIISVNIEGQVDLARRVESVNFKIDQDVKASGISKMYVTKTDYAPGSALSIAISGKVGWCSSASDAVFDINVSPVSSSSCRELDPKRITAFFVERYVTDAGLSEYRDTSNWICNIGSSDNYSSYMTEDSQLGCDFINGDNCGPVSLSDRLKDENYQIFGYGYKATSSSRTARDMRLNYNLYQDNSGFAICTSDKRRSIPLPSKDGSIGWSDADFTEINALTGTYFNQSTNTCNNISNTYKMGEVSSRIGGLVKYSIVNGFDRSDWSSKEFVKDKKYNIPNSYDSAKVADGELEVCEQPAFSSFYKKQLVLLKSLSNDPYAHKGFNTRRHVVEHNSRNFAWKSFMKNCAIGATTSGVDGDSSMNSAASLYSIPDAAYCILKDNCAWPDGIGDSNASTIWPRSGEDLISTASSCGAGAFSDSCAGRVQEWELVNTDWDGDYDWWLDACRIVTSGKHSHDAIKEPVSELGYKNVDIRPSCRVSINYDTSTALDIYMDDANSWSVYPKVFKKGDNISIRSERGAVSSSQQKKLKYLYENEIPVQERIYEGGLDGKENYHRETSDTEIKKKLDEYGWCYERAPCIQPVTGCSGYDWKDRTTGGSTHSSVAYDDGKFWDRGQYDKNPEIEGKKYKCDTNNESDMNGCVDEVIIGGMKCKKTNSTLFTKEQEKRPIDYVIKDFRAYGCGSVDRFSGDKDSVDKKAIYCNTKTKWKPALTLGTDSARNTVNGLVHTCIITGAHWYNDSPTPSMSSHNLYCHLNKTRDCGIAMGFKIYRGELHRCMSKFALACSDTRYSPEQCKIIGDSKSVGICTRKVVVKDSKGATLTVKDKNGKGVDYQKMMEYNDFANAYNGVADKTSYRNLKERGSFDVYNVSDRSQDLLIDDSIFEKTTGKNLELVTNDNCGVCVKSGGTNNGGYSVKTDLVLGPKRQSECTDDKYKGTWSTNYRTKDKTLIQAHDITKDDTNIPVGIEYYVTYSFTPVTSIAICPDKEEEIKYWEADGSASTEEDGILKSLNGISYDIPTASKIKDVYSGILGKANSIISIPKDFGRSKLNVYVAGEGPITGTSKGFDNIQSGSNVSVTIGSGELSRAGKFLYFYIQPFDTTGKLDSEKDPKKVFPKKHNLLDAIKLGDPKLIDFYSFSNKNGNGNVRISESGKLWSIIIDTQGNAFTFDHDGKYLIFNVDDEKTSPSSETYENMAISADGSNLIGYNSGIYSVLIKKPISGNDKNVILDSILGFGVGIATGGARSILDTVKDTLFGPIDPATKQCNTYQVYNGAMVQNNAMQIQTTATTASATGGTQQCSAITPNIYAQDVDVFTDKSTPTLNSTTQRYFCKFNNYNDHDKIIRTVITKIPAKVCRVDGSARTEKDKSCSIGSYSDKWISDFDFNPGFTMNSDVGFKLSTPKTLDMQEFQGSLIYSGFLNQNKTNVFYQHNATIDGANAEYQLISENTVIGKYYISPEYCPFDPSYGVQCPLTFQNAGPFPDQSTSIYARKIWAPLEFNYTYNSPGINKSYYRPSAINASLWGDGICGQLGWLIRPNGDQLSANEKGIGCCYDIRRKTFYPTFDKTTKEPLSIGYSQKSDWINASSNTSDISYMPVGSNRFQTKKYIENAYPGGTTEGLTVGGDKYIKVPCGSPNLIEKDLKIHLMSYFINDYIYESSSVKKYFKDMYFCLLMHNEYGPNVLTSNEATVRTDFSIYHGLDDPVNGTCNDVKSTFGAIANPTYTEYKIDFNPSVEALKIDSSTGYPTIPNLWCKNKDCSTGTTYNDYIPDIASKFTDRIDIYVDFKLKLNTAYYACELRNCSIDGISCNDVVYTLTGLSAPAKYGECKPNPNNPDLNSCKIFKPNPALKDAFTKTFCLYTDVNQKVFDKRQEPGCPTGSYFNPPDPNALTVPPSKMCEDFYYQSDISQKDCWVKESDNEFPVGSWYNDNDYTETSTYIESPNPPKEFVNCQEDSQGYLTCDMIDRKFTLVSSGVTEISKKTKQIKASRNKIAPGEAPNLHSVEKFSSITNCQQSNVSFNRANCQESPYYQYVYNCENGIVANRAQYLSGIINRYTCQARKICDISVYSGQNFTYNNNQTTTSAWNLGSTNQSNYTYKEICTSEDRDFTKGMIYSVFHAFVGNVAYQGFFYLLVVLFVLMNGYKMINGELEIKSKDTMMKFFRFGLAASIASPTGWIFYERFVVSSVLRFSEGMNAIAVSIVSGSPSTGAPNEGLLFSPMNETIGMILTNQFWAKMLAAVFSLPYGTGIMLFLMMMSAALTIILSVMKAITQYISSVIMLAFYLSLGPIVILGYIFDKFKDYYEKWLKNIITAIGEQFFLFVGISFMCMLSQYMIKGIIFRTVCWDTVLSIPIGDIISFITAGAWSPDFDIPILQFWTYDDTSSVASMATLLAGTSPYSAVESMSSGSGAPTIGTIFLVMIVTGVTEKFTDFAMDFAKKLGGSSSTGALGSITNTIGGLAQQMQNYAKPSEGAAGMFSKARDKLADKSKNWAAKKAAMADPKVIAAKKQKDLSDKNKRNGDSFLNETKKEAAKDGKKLTNDQMRDEVAKKMKQNNQKQLKVSAMANLDSQAMEKAGVMFSTADKASNTMGRESKLAKDIKSLISDNYGKDLKNISDEDIAGKLTFGKFQTDKEKEQTVKSVREMMKTQNEILDKSNASVDTYVKNNLSDKKLDESLKSMDGMEQKRFDEKKTISTDSDQTVGQRANQIFKENKSKHEAGNKEKKKNNQPTEKFDEKKEKEKAGNQAKEEQKANFDEYSNRKNAMEEKKEGKKEEKKSKEEEGVEKKENKDNKEEVKENERGGKGDEDINLKK